METKSKIIFEAFIRFFLAYLGCIITGLIFFQLFIFNPESWAFDFIHFGALAALFYSMLYSMTQRNAIAAYFILTLISITLLPKPYDISFSLFWNILEHISIGIAVYLYWRFPITNERASGLRPFLLAGYLMFVWAIVSAALRIYTGWYEGFFLVVYKSLQHGLLLGLGLGAGIEAGNTLITRYLKQSENV